MDNLIAWTPGMSLASVEKQAILAAFRYYRGNKTLTANSLGIAIRTLDNKLDSYKVDQKSEEERAQHDNIRSQAFLNRQRFGAAAGTPIGHQNGQSVERPQTISNGSEAGLRMEPVTPIAEESGVPMPVGSEVQKVLPAHAAKSGAKRRR